MLAACRRALWFLGLLGLVGCAPTTSKATTMLTNETATQLYATYVRGWTAMPETDRSALVARIITADAHYATPRHAAGDRATIVEDMAAFQAKFPGGHFDIGDVSAHHDVALLTWILVQADGTIVARGHDQLRVSPEGKIVSLITFAPSVPTP